MAAAATILTVVLLPTSAFAVNVTPVKTVRIQQGMYGVRFDPAIAAAHGYKIVTYSDGSQQSIPIDSGDTSKHASAIIGAATVTKGKKLITPDTIVEGTSYGDCGWSFVEADQFAPHTIWMRSGFTVNDTIESFNWLVELEDKNGTSYQGANSPGPPGGPSWSGLWDPLNQYGSSLEEVIPSYSYAWMENGELCVSGGPYLVIYVSY
jgi:hypothetical protein